MKKLIAGALFGLVVLGANRAEANMKLNLVVRSCDPAGNPWKQTDQDGRLGRLTIKDQMGQVVQTQDSVHFSASRCQATFTLAFGATTLDRFLDPADPLFLTLEACANNAATCTFANGVLDGKPVVFQSAPVDSLLPEVFDLQQEALAAEAAVRTAADSAEAQARTAADNAEAAARATADQVERLRAQAAEQAANNGLAAEIRRAMAAELAEESARQSAIAAEAQARAAAIAAEAAARIAAIQAEAAARIEAIAAEAAARATADSAEATARAAGDQDVRDYADGKFLPLAGGTVDGELVVNGMLRLNGGVSWDSCPAGLDSLEHVFGAAGGGSNRLCASAFQQTAPAVLVNEVLSSYIAPICPMVTQVVQNYVEIGGPAAIGGVNTLLRQVTTLLNDQITPFANGLISATTDVTNDLIDAINGKITTINGLIAANTATVNTVIDAYNGLVTKINTALSSSTGGLNTSITAINAYLASVRADINSVVAGTNLAVGDVNAAFASINTALGNTGTALNTFNNNPTGINDALSTLTSSLNGQIGALNGLLDSISTAQSSIVNGLNSGLLVARNNFEITVDYFNNLANNVRSQIIGPLNDAIDAMDNAAIQVGNYLIAPINTIIGPKSHANRAGLNGMLSWIQTTTLGAVNFPWFEPIGGIGATSATGMADIGFGWNIQSYLPSLAVVSAPAAIGHVGGVNAPTISSLGLPTFDLGLNASMRTIAHDLAAPALAAAPAPQINGAGLGPVAAAAIPAIGHVEIPTIPAWAGFQLEGAVDFQGVSDLIGSTMDPICADIEGTAQSYIDAFLGDVPALVPDYGDAEEVCGEMGGHVCSAGEIMLLAGDDGTPALIGYGFGDWTGDGKVMFNQSAKSGLLLEADWPFLHPDASKLMTFPPGFPFTFTPPVLPTGNFRCCASSSAVE